MSKARNPGEQLFEEYLRLYGYRFEHEKEHPGKSKHPDYSVTQNDIEILCEMKDFEPKTFPEGETVSYDAYKGLRKKIDAARKQFREYKDQICCLALHDQGDHYVDLEMPMTVLGAMYGDAGMSFPLHLGGVKPTNEPEPVFLDRGKMLNPKNKKPQNTTISALITVRRVNIGLMNLRLYMAANPKLGEKDLIGMTNEKVGFDLNEKQLGVIVWENGLAAKPLPRNIFNGPYDIRWGIVKAGQTIVHRGANLPDDPPEKRSGSRP